MQSAFEEASISVSCVRWNEDGTLFGDLNIFSFFSLKWLEHEMMICKVLILFVFIYFDNIYNLQELHIQST